MNSGALEGEAVPTPLVTPLFIKKILIFNFGYINLQKIAFLVCCIISAVVFGFTLLILSVIVGIVVSIQIY